MANSTAVASTSYSSHSFEQNRALAEILGFPPQLLIDDLINTANESVTQALEGLDNFLYRWAEEHENSEAVMLELDQGFHAFQTLLESHTDTAFDFFEVWALRNIFTIPPNVPIVAPHHEGLDLETGADEERALQTEIDELRHRLENVRISLLL